MNRWTPPKPSSLAGTTQQAQRPARLLTKARLTPQTPPMMVTPATLTNAAAASPAASTTPTSALGDTIPSPAYNAGMSDRTRPIPSDDDDRTWFDVLVDIHSGADYPGSGGYDADYEADPFEDRDFEPIPHPLHQADILITVLYQAPDISQALETVQEIARWYNRPSSVPGFSPASSWCYSQEATLAALHLQCFPPLPTNPHPDPRIAEIANIISRAICQLAELENEINNAVDFSELYDSREKEIENALAQPTLESLRQTLDAAKGALVAARIWRDAHLSMRQSKPYPF